jgi:hypothetical protein
MRTLVVFAVLALAVSAFDIEQYIQGFNQQMGFTQAQVQDGYTCFVGISQILGNIKAKLQAGDLNAAILAFQQAKTQFTVACGPYFGDYAGYAMAHSNGRQPAQNLEQYAPQIIQQVAYWINYLKVGQDAEAGKTEAYILQIIIGAETPTVLPAPQFDWNKLQQFDQDAFFQQYLGAFYNTLGLSNQVDLASIPTCIQTMQTVFIGANQIAQQFYTADFDGKIDAIQAFIDSFLQGTKDCKGLLQAEAVLLVPVFRALSQDPIDFILTVLDNTATNFPEIIQSQQQEQVDIAEGDYAAAGTIAAQRAETVFKGVVDFTN